MAEEIKKAVKPEDNRKKFVARKLKAINEMANKANARRNADRLLRGGK